MSLSIFLLSRILYKYLYCIYFKKILELWIKFLKILNISYFKDVSLLIDPRVINVSVTYREWKSNSWRSFGKESGIIMTVFRHIYNLGLLWFLYCHNWNANISFTSFFPVFSWTSLTIIVVVMPLKLNWYLLLPWWVNCHPSKALILSPSTFPFTAVVQPTQFIITVRLSSSRLVILYFHNF